jgi:hypothetical protein
MLSFRKDFKVFKTTEEFVKEAIWTKNDLLLRIEHNYGLIDIKFNPITCLLEGVVYADITDAKEMVLSVKSLDISDCMLSALHISSALHSFISDAYKMAGLLNGILVQPK